MNCSRDLKGRNHFSLGRRCFCTRNICREKEGSSFRVKETRMHLENPFLHTTWELCFCVYVWVRGYVNVCVHLSVYVCEWKNVNVSMSVILLLCPCVYNDVCKYMYANTLCMYICICPYTCVCVRGSEWGRIGYTHKYVCVHVSMYVHEWENVCVKVIFLLYMLYNCYVWQYI